MTLFKEFFDGLENKGESKELLITFRNKPSIRASRLLFENSSSLEEGKEKKWGKGHTYRVDNRPAHMGGPQIHVFGRKGQKWAYRSSGLPSEPHKYKTPATNTVKDIVSSVFSIEKKIIETVNVIKADEEVMLVEVVFV
jgi:hypothetical protein